MSEDGKAFLTVNITSSVSSFSSQKRFPSSQTIGDLKVIGLHRDSIASQLAKHLLYFYLGNRLVSGQIGADHWRNGLADEAEPVQQ